LAAAIDGLARDFPEALPVVRHDEETAWDLVRYLDDDHLPRKATVRLACAPVGIWGFDRPYRLLFDGRVVGEGSVKKGCQAEVTAVVGSHLITVKKIGATWSSGTDAVPLPLELRRDGLHRADVVYQRYQGEVFTLGPVDRT
jgi:hypothetical protein